MILVGPEEELPKLTLVVLIAGENIGLEVSDFVDLFFGSSFAPKCLKNPTKVVIFVICVIVFCEYVFNV